MGILHALKTAEYTDNAIVVSQEMLNRIQTQLMGMMKDIVDVCDKENIQWFLSGGSVLGAVRHNGFIPWDDDIDIFMKRDDYNRFESLFNKYLSDRYELKKPGDPNYLLNLPQVQKKGTRIQSIQSEDSHCDGLAIDIFILENTYDNLILRTWHGIKSTALLFIDSAMRMNRCKENIFKYTNNDIQLRKEVLKRARFARIFKFWSLEEWLKRTDRLFSEVNQKGKYLVCPSGARHFFGELYDSRLFETATKQQFADQSWNIPANPDEYLKSRYGNDYMKVPDDADKERHVYTVLELGEQL